MSSSILYDRGASRRSEYRIVIVEFGTLFDCVFLTMIEYNHNLVGHYQCHSVAMMVLPHH